MISIFTHDFFQTFGFKKNKEIVNFQNGITCFLFVHKSNMFRIYLYLSHDLTILALCLEYILFGFDFHLIKT